MTRLTFRQGAQILARCEVCRCSLDQELRSLTDDRGQIVLDLAPGIHWIKVQTPARRWLYTVLQLDGGERELEINLEEIKRRGHTGKVFQSHQHLQHHLMSLRDRFDLAEILGQGGMGIVLKAKDKMLGRWVALKIKHRHTQPHDATFLINEAQRLASLSHPNLIAIYDILDRDDDLILITEYVKGLSLDQQLRAKGPLRERALLRAAIQLCRALQYMHDQGYIHRDLKPANLMLSPDYTLKLIDFGLATPLRDIELGLNPGHGGTPGYLAPEQLLGYPASIQTDLYQLGVTLYELATGVRPAPQPTSPLLPLDKLRPELSNELAYLVARCLEHDPAKRWRSAAQLLSRLQRLYHAQDHAKRRANEDPITRTYQRQAQRRGALLRYAPLALSLLVLTFTLGLALGRFLT